MVCLVTSVAAAVASYPTTLSSDWSLLGTRHHYTAYAACDNPGCSRDCLQSTRKDPAQACRRCECSLCPGCAATATRWRSPSGQVLESIVTNTQPRFNFAFSRNAPVFQPPLAGSRADCHLPGLQG